MIRRRKLLALTLAAAMAVLCLGCDDRLLKACDAITRGTAFLDTYALTGLDTAAGLGLLPGWYPASRSAYVALKTSLVGRCEQARGNGVEFEDVAQDLAAAAVEIERLIRLFTELRAAGTIPAERATEVPDPAQLLADLARVREEARGVYNDVQQAGPTSPASTSGGDRP